jgi:hypothetical protein
MIIVPEQLQRVFAGLMKMYGVFFKAIIRGQVHAAAEPPNRLGARFARFQITHVQMHCWRVGVTGMQYNGYTHCLEPSP